jgi:hypothetical protein
VSFALIGANVVLSKREKYIGIGVIAAVALLGINSLVINPYEDKLDQLHSDQIAANKKYEDNKLLLHKQQVLQPAWQELVNTGLEGDYSDAQRQTQQALQTWARNAGVTLNSINSVGAPLQRGVFQIINFNVDFDDSGQPSMRHIANLLWSIESANIPIRIDDVKITSAREGTDQLSIKLAISVLYMPPAPANGAGAQQPVAAG